MTFSVLITQSFACFGSGLTMSIVFIKDSQVNSSFSLVASYDNFLEGSNLRCLDKIKIRPVRWLWLSALSLGYGELLMLFY